MGNCPSSSTLEIESNNMIIKSEHEVNTAEDLPPVYSELDTGATKRIYKPDASAGDVGCEVSIFPCSNHEGVFVRVVPPYGPAIDAGRQPIDYIPCDVVLVIDVSGSMNDAAPSPPTGPDQELENTGLSILDLVKHSVRSILSRVVYGYPVDYLEV
ncbi:hypothetical protein F5Y16DRAFT_422499 [Xylariaceae sp. FL0255]|nr:hypothetical protein F5Y16DRAFT_422499 [Xylariaceae sp. FL0255]